MDLSAASLSGIAKTTPVGGSPDDLQLIVLKKAQDLQAQGALQLLQSAATGPQPLASSGPLGTKVNTYA